MGNETFYGDGLRFLSSNNAPNAARGSSLVNASLKMEKRFQKSKLFLVNRARLLNAWLNCQTGRHSLQWKKEGQTLSLLKLFSSTNLYQNMHFLYFQRSLYPIDHWLCSHVAPAHNGAVFGQWVFKYPSTLLTRVQGRDLVPRNKLRENRGGKKLLARMGTLAAAKAKNRDVNEMECWFTLVAC